MALVGFELAALVAVEGELALFVFDLVAVFGDAVALGFEDGAHVFGFFFAAGGELADGALGEDAGAFFELVFELGDVLGGGGAQAADDGVGDVAEARGGEGVFEEAEDLGLVAFAQGAEAGASAGRGLAPLGGDGDELVVEAGGAAAVEGEAAEDDDAQDRVVGADDAGPGELVVEEALGEEVAKEALDEAVLEVEPQPARKRASPSSDLFALRWPRAFRTPPRQGIGRAILQLEPSLYGVRDRGSDRKAAPERSGVPALERRLTFWEDVDKHPIGCHPTSEGHPYGWPKEACMADMEKLTINLTPVDVGQIELLVEQGFYSNRAEFIRVAIREQLAKHAETVQEAKTRHAFVLGALAYDREALERHRRDGRHLAVHLVGLLSIAADVPPELARDVIESVKVRGVFKASDAVKEALADRTS